MSPLHFQSVFRVTVWSILCGRRTSNRKVDGSKLGPFLPWKLLAEMLAAPSRGPSLSTPRGEPVSTRYTAAERVLRSKLKRRAPRRKRGTDPLSLNSGATAAAESGDSDRCCCSCENGRGDTVTPGEGHIVRKGREKLGR